MVIAGLMSRQTGRSLRQRRQELVARQIPPTTQVVVLPTGRDYLVEETGQRQAFVGP